MDGSNILFELLKFDIKSILLLLFWGNIFLFIMVCGYNLTRGTSENRKQLMMFAQAKIIQAVSWLLVAGRGNIPAFFSVNAANSLLLAGFFVESITLLEIIKCKNKKIYMAQTIILLLSVCIFNFITVKYNYFNLRVAVISVSTFFILIMPTMQYILNSGGNPFRKFFGYLYGFYMAVVLIRGLNAFWDVKENIFSATPIQHITFLISSLMMVTVGAGIVLMLNEQKEIEIKKHLADKDKFFSIIAHDLKNPFQAILGYLEIMKTHIQDFNKEEIIKITNVVYDSTKQTLSLLENLLEWARIQQGKIPFKPQPINIAEIITGVALQIEPIAKLKNITMHSAIGDHTVLADKYYLSTIMRNLLTNAVKFTNQNGRIEISSTDKGEYVEISVSDNGVGIDDRTKDLIFNIDVSSVKKGTANETGTGLGLILCKEFVNIQGGEIRVESAIGKGSNFCFTVPLCSKSG